MRSSSGEDSSVLVSRPSSLDNLRICTYQKRIRARGVERENKTELVTIVSKQEIYHIMFSTYRMIVFVGRGGGVQAVTNEIQFVLTESNLNWQHFDAKIIQQG